MYKTVPAGTAAVDVQASESVPLWAEQFQLALNTVKLASVYTCGSRSVVIPDNLIVLALLVGTV